jgi:hypothetical protein
MSLMFSNLNRLHPHPGAPPLAHWVPLYSPHTMPHCHPIGLGFYPQEGCRRARLFYDALGSLPK